MPTGRRFRLPIDPWPRASLGERMAVGSVLVLLLAVPCLAAAILCLLTLVVVAHIGRSYDVGAAARVLIARGAVAIGRRLARDPGRSVLRGPHLRGR